MKLIEQLAELLGFHLSYFGSFGDHVLAKEQALSGLLEAMGFKLDEVSLHQSIELLNHKQWTDILPVVHVAKHEDQLHSINISLPKKDNLHLDWLIKTEYGDEINGSVNTKSLQLIDEAHLNDSIYGKYVLPIPSLKQGYHQLFITINKHQVSCPLIFAPKTCFSAKEASVKKVWGYTAQLYSLKSNNNWGIGDFTDLYNLVETSAEQQAATIGLNPLHPLYLNNPAHRSPYSPSTRCFINTLYIDVTKVDNFELCALAQSKMCDPKFSQRINNVRNSHFVDYPEVAALKKEIMELLFEDFLLNRETRYLEMADDFEQFKESRGGDLVNFATFDALYEFFHKQDEHVYGWNDWPVTFQDPKSDEVKQFQTKYADRIEYYCYLQWVAHKQLSAASQCAKDQNMPIGLYLDLAVGCDGSGVDVWSDQDLYVTGASIGAPPDGMNPLGQNWGLTPVNPIEMQKKGYQPLVKALRNSMQYAGALRIDHILGLMRQYWVAPGMEADEGVYISFPFEDILRIIALESRRNNCIVIGEDLGNVPEGFSETIQNAGLLSFKVMFFERWWETGLFKRPDTYPSQSVVTMATHDTATLAGWWEGRDLQWREELNLYPSEEAGHADRNGRDDERHNLIAALNDLGVIDMLKAPQQNPAVMNTELTISVQKYLAASNSHVQLISLEDALELPEQVNIPGTIDQHPNWLQKLPVLVEDLWKSNSMEEIAKSMRAARPM